MYRSNEGCKVAVIEGKIRKRRDGNDVNNARGLMMHNTILTAHDIIVHVWMNNTVNTSSTRLCARVDEEVS